MITEELIKALNTMNVTYTVSNKGERYDFESVLGGDVTVFPSTMTTIYNSGYTKVDRECRKDRLMEVISDHISIIYYKGITK